MHGCLDRSHQVYGNEQALFDPGKNLEPGYAERVEDHDLGPPDPHGLHLPGPGALLEVEPVLLGDGEPDDPVRVDVRGHGLRHLPRPGQTNYLSSQLFLYSFVFFSVCVINSLFISVIVDAFETAKQPWKVSQQPKKPVREVLEECIGKLEMVRGQAGGEGVKERLEEMRRMIE